MNAITRIRDLIGGILFWMVILGGMGPAHAAITTGDLTYLDASIIEVSQGQLMFNRRTGEYTLTLTLRNVSGSAIPAADGMVYLAIENLTPSVASIKNNPGTSSEGLPYYEISTDDLMPGGSVAVVVSFINPSRQRYSFDANSYIQQGPVNRRPVANAGADINTVSGSEVKLDATGSYDPDGDLVTLHWTLVSAPENSLAMLADESSTNPRLTPDLAGEYVFELIANDGQMDSEPDTVTVTAFDAVSPPNARAGPDQHVLTGSLVSLDGSASDDPKGLSLSFDWSVSEVPTGSSVTDADIWLPDQSRAEFIPDVDGSYVFNLRVDNAILTDDDSVQVFASGSNVPPTADAGPEKAARTQEVVTLDGTGSFDPDDGPQALSHSWSLVARPSGSSLTNNDIVNANTANPSLTLDSEGPYIARLRVDDGAASDVDNVLVLADDTPPEMHITAPIDGTTVDTPRPIFDVMFSDDASGIDPGSFAAQLDGVEIGDLFSLDEFGATYRTTSDLFAGPHTLRAAVRDKAGNSAETHSDFSVSVFRALPGASPTSGPVPLTVNFTTNAEYSDGAILRYRWDFQGDGVFDTSAPGERNYTYTFTSKGVYNAVLEVLNDQNETAVASVRITVTGNPPTAVASINPSNGQVPLAVNFTGVGSDKDGQIVLYEWDFEGDGVFDFSSTTTGSTSHTYSSPGTFNALFRVTDNDGLTATASATATAVRVGPPGSPTATITSPGSSVNCNAPCNVSFNGLGSDADGTIVLYEWDRDGDGVYDVSSATSASTSFTYSSPGLYVASFRVTDNDGLTGIDTIEVNVTINASLSLLTDTCSAPVGGGSVNVRTSISGTTPVTIYLKNKAGERVRTLVNHETRSSGSYTDTWNCTADSGVFATEGVYYAVLEYEDVNGSTRTLDQSQTTGGQLFNPSWVMEGSSCFSCRYVFRPLEDDFLDVDMTLTRAAEVTVSVRVFRLADEVVRLMDRKPLGRGLHRLKWDGSDAFGNFAHPPAGRQFIFGVTAFTLPNNGIFVEGAPRITGFSVDPNYFDPATPDFLTPDAPTATVTFDVSKDSTAVLQVFRVGSNRLMKTINQPVAAGTQILVWNGRNEDNIFVDKGDYRLALKAIDAQGNQSLVRYMRVRVFY